jgi:putative acetyltransferase
VSAVPISSVRVRPEEPGDAAAIRRVNQSAFDGYAEADLVDALRTAGAITLSMVAVIGAEVIGGEEVGDLGEAEVSTWGGEGAGWGDDSAADGEQAAWGSRLTGGEVVGHALVSPVTVTTETGEAPLLGLGPVAVLPADQGQGIGTLLVETCLEQLRESRHAGIVVAGLPGYYPRFGFIPASRWGLRWEFDVPDEVFMALELTPGLLSGVRGVVRYRPEFTESASREQGGLEAREDPRS